MDELGQLILGERPKSQEADRSNVIAPKKSAMSGRNPQLQPEIEKPDELGALILGGSEPKQGQINNASQGMLPSVLQNLFEAKKQVPAFAASALDVVAGVPAAIAETVGYGAGRLFGLSPEEATAASQKVAGKIAEPVGRLTGTAGTKQYEQALPTQAMQKVGQAIQSNVVEPIAQRTGANVTDVGQGVNAAMMALSMAARPVARGLAEAKAALPTVRIERTAQPSAMQSGGAAATTNKTTLDAAIAQASPELAAQLAKEKPATISPEVLQRYLDADAVGVRLLKGQATQNPGLISFERNVRSQDPRLVERLSEQNKALQEKAASVKEAAAPDVSAPDYVANAEGAMEFIDSKIKQNEKATSEAYKALDEFGAGKIQVDSKSFAENAMKALSEKEDIDFLPSVVKNKIEAYQSGKPMNFAQYENLRTQIARETRKAQKADDGNAVHALTLVRGELEKLPLIGESVEAKALADKARATAKSEFDLLNRDNPAYNKVYADLVNGKTDTKDFIQSAVLRSKNKDFAKTMELFDDPVAKQHLRAGALDIIIKDATDASGNFKPARFAKAIENLEVNKKLDVLFGEEAQTLRKIAKTGQLVEARPAGAFVNESNTAGALVAQYGKKLAEQTPIVGRFVEPARQLLQERASKKAVQESLRPGAGVKLKDIGKD
jgi:methionine synthase II (cobalamin-independent)